jgi:Alpha-L-arabinofuranosidase C-terminal domain/Domain of Unknown Function (DUF1080)
MRSAFASLVIFSATLALSWNRVQGDDASAAKVTLRVEAGKDGRRVSRYLTGACIEDVNHEIYGGIYSQMVFGESFQEPGFRQPIRDFVAHGGTWATHDAELDGSAGPGPKLVSNHPPFSGGEVGVEVFFADRVPGNAGLIVKTHRPGEGADNFTGYEVSLDPAASALVLGRHRQNWEPLKTVPCKVPVGAWVSLLVRMTETTLEVEVDGKSLLTYEDRDHPLRTGGLGLRQWQRPARYRNLVVRTKEHTERLRFETNPDDLGPVSGMWRGIRGGSATAKYSLETDRPFVGGQSQRVTFLKGEGEVGVENQGLNRWGLALSGGKECEGHLWARVEAPVDLVVELESRDGKKVHAQTTLHLTGTDWSRVRFTLTPKADEDTGRLVLKLTKPGSVTLGYVFLQPGKWGRFKELPCRRDVVEGLIDQGVTALRYGGSMVNAREYRWKKMIGPRDHRPPYPGTWYPYSTNGWGIVDFLDLCEAAGFLGIPAFHMGETPQDMADFVAYANGPADSGWGKKRATDGHPAPYRLRHIELGNEERVDDTYFERFKAIAEAVWAIDSEVILIVGDFVYGKPITDPDRVTGAASGITNLSAHRKILDLARRHNREVWFDIHIGTEHPGALGELAAVPSYVAALEKLAPGAKHRVVVFELNAGNHSQRRALANAIALGRLQQLADRLPIVCSANALQPDCQNDNGWNQGLLFLNPSQVWLQPPGFVTRMAARSYRPVNVPVRVDGKLEAAAARSEDGKSLVLRVVNPGDAPVSARLSLDGFEPRKPTATVESLEGPADAVNTAADPHRITPRAREWRHGLGEGASAFTFPPRSFTILTFE